MMQRMSPNNRQTFPAASHMRFAGKQMRREIDLSAALPERGVTVHSGDMGYTMGPFAGSAKCPGRRVNPWTND